MLDEPALPHHFGPEHEAFRASLRAFVAREITPFVDAWDEQGSFPRQLYRQAAEIGATGVGVRTFVKLAQSYAGK